MREILLKMKEGLEIISCNQIVIVYLVICNKKYCRFYFLMLLRFSYLVRIVTESSNALHSKLIKCARNKKNPLL